MLIILTGPTASGKDTIMKSLLQKFPQLERVVTTTSRKIRQGEQDGLDYHFIAEEEFKQKIDQGEFIEYVKYGDNFYGTEKKYLDATSGKDAIWRIDPSRAGQIRELIKSRDVLVIYILISEDESRQRLSRRNLKGEVIEKRILQDKADWQHYKDKYDFVVENPHGKLKETVDKIAQLIENQLN